MGQLQGEVLSDSDVSLNCSPLYKNGSLLLNPCGLIANSFFTGKQVSFFSSFSSSSVFFR
jgi:hypothetical protein